MLVRGSTRAMKTFVHSLPIINYILGLILSVDSRCFERIHDGHTVRVRSRGKIATVYPVHLGNYLFLFVVKTSRAR